MNIFATDPCPRLSALALDDLRANKMVVETAQLMCTAIALSGGTTPYRPTHANHPCAVWARASLSNYMWLARHLRALLDMRPVDRPQHATDAAMSAPSGVQRPEAFLPDIGPTPFVNCAARSDLGIDFRHVADVHEAYRLYLDRRWMVAKRPPRWTGRMPPPWSSFTSAHGPVK